MIFTWNRSSGHVLLFNKTSNDRTSKRTHERANKRWSERSSEGSFLKRKMLKALKNEVNDADCMGCGDMGSRGGRSGWGGGKVSVSLSSRYHPEVMLRTTFSINLKAPSS